MRTILNVIWLLFGGAWSTIGNVIWVIVAGWWLAIGHIVTSIPMFLSIVGIPLGLANLKMIQISLLPLGKMIVPSDNLRFAKAQQSNIGRVE
ncbi:YccF domain-containing protein [Ornithinimicrobium sp. INDO-MA30-4]|uniref:YccF domain-containing protein n=1 Tax=Ornithinimicrobium sp. INDO-MA30-4 TaxID=2908651 RepID=UPI001F413EBF|nr:YccF domain-containing protein [Ornithinimicrobium sp. INDO-MA30-4]UJH71653.1 hypothetical protein L0A91_13380 [Ornithinimicrobium sp. INDO-MA30-4]